MLRGSYDNIGLRFKYFKVNILNKITIDHPDYSFTLLTIIFTISTKKFITFFFILFPVKYLTYFHLLYWVKVYMNKQNLSGISFVTRKLQMNNFSITL